MLSIRANTRNTDLKLPASGFVFLRLYHIHIFSVIPLKIRKSLQKSAFLINFYYKIRFIINQSLFLCPINNVNFNILNVEDIFELI